MGSIIRLPDGQTYTVNTVFGGFFFKSHELNTQEHSFPVGWTVVLRTAVESDAELEGQAGQEASSPPSHSFTQPTLQRDSLFISSISTSSAFRPPVSPTRNMAQLLWITLHWYFNQPAPDATLDSSASRDTPAAGKPRGVWRVNIRRDGVLRGHNLLPKLERMGLIASVDTAAGILADDEVGCAWDHMFVSRRMFWQLPARLFLFTLQPNTDTSRSRRASLISSDVGSHAVELPLVSTSPTGSLLGDQRSILSDSPSGLPHITSGPFYSTSHLPTYFPPPPLQYVMTEHTRHPLRPKPPRVGEVFYTRFVPSVGQFLSLRTASPSLDPVPYTGPVGPNPPSDVTTAFQEDAGLIRRWLSIPRVSAFWGNWTPEFLKTALASRHSFPVIGLWDGVPFGYFEIYWVREDILGRHLGAADTQDFDRGIHFFVGEEWSRGRVQSWLTSLVHWIFEADYRTMNVWIEPRVDNARLIGHLLAGGFQKEREIAFPHKQSWVGRLRRDTFEGPAL